MTPSEERSSSAVRNLRSLFENRANDNSPSTRGRSPAGLGSEADSRPKSAVRASFFPVDSPNRLSGMASPPETETSIFDLSREPSTGGRTSFGEDKNSTVPGAIKDAVHAVATPLVEVDKQLGKGKKQKGKGKGSKGLVDKPAENPDKPVTGAEEEPADMKPAQLTDEGAVSGGAALPAVAEDLRKADGAAAKNENKTANAHTTAEPPATAVATKSAPRPSTSSVKSPRAASTASNASVLSPKVPTKKPSRSSLTAPTAASVARAAAADKNPSTAAKPSSAPKPKSRETTKPLDISSRLTAPTAASRAKYEAPTAPEPKSTTIRPKPTASSRSTPRPSLGRPQSRTSEHEAKKLGAPVSGSFLERMTRPTAASSGRTQKEAEVKSAPAKTQKLPHRPKANGHPKSAASASGEMPMEDEVATTTTEDPAAVDESDSIQEPIEEGQTRAEDVPEEKATPSVATSTSDPAPENASAPKDKTYATEFASAPKEKESKTLATEIASAPKEKEAKPSAAEIASAPKEKEAKPSALKEKEAKPSAPEIAFAPKEQEAKTSAPEIASAPKEKEAKTFAPEIASAPKEQEAKTFAPEIASAPKKNEAKTSAPEITSAPKEKPSVAEIASAPKEREAKTSAPEIASAPKEKEDKTSAPEKAKSSAPEPKEAKPTAPEPELVKPVVAEAKETMSTPEAKETKGTVSDAKETKATTSKAGQAKLIDVEESKGSATPLAATNGHSEQPPALESTPAAAAFEDLIR